jgi:amino acid adenylation domain-containing protein
VNSVDRVESVHETDIAIIGLSCRFPGARTADEFWRNLREGVESITTFSDEELLADGIHPSFLTHPRYVKAGSILDNIESFDASFFGFTPREAEILDPQQRLFLECAWEALEDAGYDAMGFEGLIGVFAGAGMNNYMVNLYTHPELNNSVSYFQIVLGNDKDFLATRVAYKLNLKGPSLSVQTACSTSLVAVHLGCQSLINGECDICLAGGVSIRVPQKAGYMYQEGGICSPDGHCRAFDAQARGTVGGSGVGIVVLKRLADALRDGDCIHAIIKGSAINNDGALKVGFTAPSVEGQANVIAEALAMAGVGPETVSYIEAHGTGTTLGDPIEIAALTKAFRASTPQRGFCAIGSVKTNIGHLDTAAGVAGLIKTVLALKHKLVPPSLHFERPNPKIDLANSPFFVNTTARPWPANSAPRRAGVSSFGIGGTNAHVIVEEAPPSEAVRPARPWHLLVLSAKTNSALAAATVNLREHLSENPALPLADVAYTLQVGRRAFSHRRMLVCRDREDAIEALGTLDPRRAITAIQESSDRPVIFMFPGQGAHSVNMGRELYEVEPTFRHWVDRCSELLDSVLKLDLRTILYPSADAADAAEQQLKQTALAQPALFMVEYALARLWMGWGIRPQAMIGHSLGEYVAACLAGVLSLEEAVRLVAIRGQLMQALPTGAMLAVPLSEPEVQSRLNNQLSLAAINGPSRCVVSGPIQAVDLLERHLTASGVGCSRLHTSHAFHSEMVETIMDPFIEEVKKTTLNPPTIPYVSNVTGTWMTATDAVDPGYWAKHLRQTVRFAQGLDQALKQPGAVLLEIGPGQTLSTLARPSPNRTSSHLVLSSLPRHQDRDSDVACVLNALGRLWLAGIAVDWSGFYVDQRRRRVSLPTYPFERQRYWIKPSILKGPETMTEPERRYPPAAQGSTSGPSALIPDLIKEPEIVMSDSTSLARRSSPRRDRLLSSLKMLVHRMTGVDAADIDTHATFLEMGVDSLVLIRGSQEIRQTFGVDISLRQLMEELSTLEALADYLEQALPADEPLATSPSVLSPQLSAPSPDQPAVLDITGEKQSSNGGPDGLRENGVPRSRLEQIISQQLHILSQQLELLRNGHQALEPSPSHTSRPALVADIAPAPPKPAPGRLELETFVPYRPIQPGTQGGLTPRQQEYLESFMARYIRRTQQSKRLVGAHRQFLADNRSCAGFRLLWKEMVYPIVGERSSGSRIWDVDGNEYIDLTMGFGVHLFGHSPDFIVEALEKQIRQGMQLGPQSYLAGQVAELICELTGLERVSFVSSGTEAVMTALRLARTVTGREKIALFAGSYHGSFDGVLARVRAGDGEPSAIPVAPGIPQAMVNDVLVLEYGHPRSLEVLNRHLHELAAVLVEPVQSRRPDIQPKEFLHQVRRMTEQTETVLIMDEMVTGFRVHPGGAQAWFGVQADLATYGKIVGGGLPIGVVAGKAKYMGAVDGGLWNFGDSSYPRALQTVFGGTFWKHPLSMAASLAVLNQLKSRGPALQQELNQKAGRLVETLNACFERHDLPIRVANFGSLFTFLYRRDLQFLDLLFYHLVAKGVYAWEGRTSFLSTAHTAEDIDYVIRAVEQSIEELQAGGFFPPARKTGVRDQGSGECGMRNAECGFEENSSSIRNPQPAVRNPESVRTLPLTEAQKQLWIIAQLGDDASRAYNESATLDMRGRLNVEALRKALVQVLNRHEALRTTFSPEGDYQQIHPTLAVDVPLIDFSQADPDERHAEVTRWLTEATRPVFDLVHGPLVRVQLVKLEEEHHLLVLTIHHLVTDGWSVGVLLRELGVLYSAECRGIAAQLPEPIQFSQYAQWQAEQQDTPQLAADEVYWLEHFAPSIPVLELPTDRPRPPVQTFSGARECLTIQGPLYQDLKRLSVQQRSTLFLILLAGFKALLHRLSGQRDIVVGVPAAGQLSVNGQDVVGYCINLLPIYTPVEGEPTFSEYLASVRQVLSDAYEHQGYAYDRLIKKLYLLKDPSRLPLITAVFNLDHQGSKPTFGDLEVDLTLTPTRSAKFDLFLNLTQKNNELVLACEYKTDLFDPPTIRRWMRHFETLLSGIVANPDEALSRLPLLTEAERQQLLVEWNNTEMERQGDGEMGRQGDRETFSPSLPLPLSPSCWVIAHTPTLAHLFEAQVEQTPEAVALVFEDEQVSFRELNRRANQLGHYLRELGVGPEVRVGICLERSVEMVVAMLGVLKAGGVYVPLDPAYPADRLAFILEDARVSVLLTQEQLAGDVPAIGPKVCLETEFGAHALAHLPETNPPSEVGPGNLAYLIYTSGSTGQPKGVAIEHRHAVALIEWAGNEFTPEVLSGVLASTSICFDLSVFELFVPLSWGGRVILARHALELPELPAARAVTLINTVPSAMSELIREDAVSATVHTVNLAGEPLARHLVRQIYERTSVHQVANLYGPSEDTTYSTAAWLSKETREAPSIGRPLANKQVYVLDQQWQPVPIGIAGELYIGGAGVARGYLDRPALTAERFLPDPFVGMWSAECGMRNEESESSNLKSEIGKSAIRHPPSAIGSRLYKTGDLARFRVDGSIEFLGRLDHQVKMRGFRIELGEVEAVLSQHPGVQDTVVVMREDEPGEKRLVAYVVADQEPAPSNNDLRSFLKQKLPEYMLPSSFVLLKKLPLTPNGKVDRRALPAPDRSRPKLGKAYAAPRTTVEQQLCAIWAEVLGIEQVGIDDNFLDLGVDSIVSIKVAARARRIGIQFTPMQVFQHPTVAELVQVAELIPADQPGQALTQTQAAGVGSGSPSDSAAFKWTPTDLNEIAAAIRKAESIQT